MYRGLQLLLQDNGTTWNGRVCDEADCFEDHHAPGGLIADGPYHFCPEHFAQLEGHPAAQVTMSDPKVDAAIALQNRFVYHPPKGDQQQRYERIRAKCYELAAVIVADTPASREQSVALTYLDQVMFNSNAAIARNE